MRKSLRRKIKTKTGQKEYDGLASLRIPIHRDSRAETQSAADRRKGAIDAFVSKAREWAGKVLRAAGLPDTLRTVRKHQDGTWTELPKNFWAAVDALPDGESIKTTNVLTLVYAQEPVPDLPGGWEDWPFEKVAEYLDTLPPPPVDVEAPTNGRELSLEWLACQLLERAESLEAALAAGDLLWAALAKGELADAWRLAVFAEKHELPAAIGLAQLGVGHYGAGGGSPGTDEDVLAKVQRQADAVWRINPNKSMARTFEEIQKKHGIDIGLSTFKRRIKKPSESQKK